MATDRTMSTTWNGSLMEGSGTTTPRAAARSARSR